LLEKLRTLHPAWLDPGLLALFGVGSLVLFVLGVVAVPIVLAELPVDYYSRPARDARPTRSTWLGWLGFLARNAFGAALVCLGILLLVLPGQGVLTVALGLMLLDFPGRARLERKIVGRPRVFAAINALRRRARRPPLEMPQQD
jgi:hypothetical protein